jgi:CRP-like cAMP-binding protein
VGDEPLLAQHRPVEVLLVDFAASAILYRVQCWSSDFSLADQVRDRVRSRIYYAFGRRGILIPYPIQVQVPQVVVDRTAEALRLATALRSTELFGSLSEDERAALLGASRRCVYAAGEAIVRQAAEGRSMFVVVRGEAAVTVAPSRDELTRLGAGQFFGEMSLLTGEPRSATVTAVTDCELLEIGADTFREIALGDSVLVERVSTAVATRRAEQEIHRATRAAATGEPEPSQTFLARVRQFLRLAAPPSSR